MYSAVSSSAYSAIRMRKRWLIEVVIPNGLAKGSGWFRAFTGHGVGGIAGRTPGGPSHMPADPSTSPPRRRIPAWGPKRIADGGWHNLPRGKLSCARAGNLARNSRALGSVRESPWESHPKPLQATQEPHQSQLVGNQLGTQSQPKATPKPHQSHPHATPKPPSS